MRRVLIAALSVGSCALVASAKVPEPDTILCGTLKQQSGVEIRSSAAQTIKVQAVVDGVTLASAEMPSNSNSFVLRIPMDDGVSPRIAGTAKSSDLVRLMVVNAADGTTVETAETQVKAIEIPEERGSVISADFVVDGSILGDDQDGDGIPDEWERKYAVSRFAGVKPLLLTANDSALDNDNDGLSNYDEFVAATDPLDSKSKFIISDVCITPDLITVKFGPVAADRLYSLLYRKSLSETDKWTTVDQYRPVEPMKETTWEVRPQAADGGFYRLRVELMP